MRTISSRPIVILLSTFLLFNLTETIRACDVGVLISPQAVVRGAQLIIRAKAVEFVDKKGVRFQTLEVIKGQDAPDTLFLTGYLSKDDDFNNRSLPYWEVRRAGGGPCFAYEYRKGGEFLLMLQKRKGELTPYWYPLAATNEQLHSAEDEWITWVKDYLKELENATELEKIKATFELSKRVANWNLESKEVLWRYRFIDSNQEKLQRLAKHLDSLGYKNSKISKVEDEEATDDYQLEIEKREKHSPATLAQRNEEFKALAKSFEVRKYYEWLSTLF